MEVWLPACSHFGSNPSVFLLGCVVSLPCPAQKAQTRFKCASLVGFLAAELLPWCTFPCDNLVQRVRIALLCRGEGPCLGAKFQLYHSDSAVQSGDSWQLDDGSGQRVEFTEIASTDYLGLVPRLDPKACGGQCFPDVFAWGQRGHRKLQGKYWEGHATARLPSTTC